MKVRVKIDIGSVRVDQTVEGATAEDIVRTLRKELEARAPFLVRPVIRAMDDRALWRKIVELHNSKFHATEPVPQSAEEFLQFGERTGYVTRLA
jgi:hypothetical protein